MEMAPLHHAEHASWRLPRGCLLQQAPQGDYCLAFDYYSLFKGYCNITKKSPKPSTKVTVDNRLDKENFDIPRGFHRGLQHKKSLSIRSATGYWVPLTFKKMIISQILGQVFGSSKGHIAV